jgi:hypothetical protein
MEGRGEQSTMEWNYWFERLVQFVKDKRYVVAIA